MLLQNEAGALTRVAGLFSSRGYNIESLHVAPTENDTLSRLTVVTTGPDEVINQICSQLLKLVDVVNLVDMTQTGHIERELMLLKLCLNDGVELELRELLSDARARVLDDRPATFTLEMTASAPAIQAFLAEIGRLGEITAVVRSGTVAIGRGAARHG